MLTINSKEIRDLERKFHALKTRAMPIVIKRTLNDTAAQAMREGKKGVRKDMVLRGEGGRWTLQSIRFRRTRTNKINRMAAATGSTEPYLETQEFGGVKRKKSGSTGVVLPTTTSSGESKNKRPRKRLPKSSRSLEGIRLRRTPSHPGQPKNKRQAFVLKMIEAQRKGGEQFFHQDFKGMGTKREKKGIFMTIGGSKSKRGIPKGMSHIRMVHDLTEPSVNIKPTKWLLPASRRAMRKQPEFYAKALKFQLRRAARIRGGS